jgi:hypothetical protein
MIKEGGGQITQGFSTVSHTDDGDLALLYRGGNIFCYDGDGACLERFVQVRVAVGMRTLHGDEQVAGLYLPAVEANRADLHRQGVGTGVLLDYETL